MTRPSPALGPAPAGDPYWAPDDNRGTLHVLEVGPVAHGGHCVARTEDGQVVFVRHALPGERVRAQVTDQRKAFLRADAVEVLRASPDRVTPPCPWAGPDRCGGCDLQHVSPPAQRELKAAVVREQLTRLGGLSPAEVDALGVLVLALPGVPGEPDGLGWRTRVQYTVDYGGRAGLLKHRSHEVVPVDWCRIAHPAVRAATVDGVGILDRDWPDHDAVEVVAPAGGEVAVLGRRGRTRPVPVSGPGTVTEHAVGRDWRVPALAFWQVHPAAADTLAATVVELLGPRAGERAWDLYGGVGIFAAALAPHLGQAGDSERASQRSEERTERGAGQRGAAGRLTVVESDPAAARAARTNLADLTTVTVVESDVERQLRDRRWRSVDIVVLDPPRSGAGSAVVDAIVARRPRAVAYVACDPAALARDVRAFRGQGWRLAALRAFDLFPQTHHVECVALLTPEPVL